MVEEGLSAPRLHLDQPQDHVAVALAGPAQGREAVDDGRLEPDQAFAPLALVCGSMPTLPSGNVAVIASKAAGVIEMRITNPVTLSRTPRLHPFASATRTSQAYLKFQRRSAAARSCVG